MFIQERLLQYIGYKGITHYKFCKDLNFSMGYLDKRGAIGTDKYVKIIEYYNDINPDWLLTGRGAMIKENISNELNIKHIESIQKTHNPIKKIQDIHLYDTTNTNKLIELFESPKESLILDKIRIPGIANCDGAIVVTGNAMEPLLKNGDIVIYKIIDVERIFWGEIYLLSVNFSKKGESIVLRYLQKSEKGDKYIKLVSTNDYYQSQDILIENITAIALVRASIRIHSL